MTDVHEPAVRSYNMSQIKSKNTKPELVVRKFLYSNGFRFRVHENSLPGKPDIVLKKYHTVIFVNGCFWHRHQNCKYFTEPKTNAKWWLEKIEKNVIKDETSQTRLKEMGWDVIIIWECQLKPSFLQITLNELLDQIRRTKKNI